MPKILIRHPSGMNICYQALRAALEHGAVRMADAAIISAQHLDSDTEEDVPTPGSGQNPFVDRWFWPEPGTTVWVLPDDITPRRST